ncbi:MAG: pyruvate carboxyltransferase [Chloroflexi bacterium]|nr:pyruvate carboxyltransferase [Chloroflexota bacterium]
MTTKEPWKSDSWFVSPWNFLPEVTQDSHPPKQVRIHDITLRDGEQQSGIVFRKDDKIRIAEKLAEAGVHRIEAGMPVVSPQDEAAIKEIVKRNLGPQIFSFCRCMVDDVKRAVDCGVDGIVIEIPCSQHLIEHSYKWPLEKAMSLPIKATQFAREQGLYTVFFTIDATRSNMDWYLNLIQRVAQEGHMDALAIVDTFGVLSPQGAFYYTKTVKERINRPLEIHFHNTFGMATANTIMSVLAGGEVVHSTVTGIGEGPGNCPMEETVMALLILYGVDVGIKYDKLTELSQLVGEIAGTPANRPFVSDGVYDIESGIVASWYRNSYEQHPTYISPILPQVVGHRAAEVVMGKKSGLDSVTIWADKLGIDLTEEETGETLHRVKQCALDLKRLLREDEFSEIALAVKKVKG